MKFSPAFATLRAAILAVLFVFPPLPCQALFRDNDQSSVEWQVSSPGTLVPGAGDLNGDGFSDLVFFASPYIRIYLGSADGPPATPSQTVNLGSAIGNDLPGYGNISSIGDFNGDGYGDLLVFDRQGSPLPGNDWNPVLWLYLGSASGLSVAPASSYETTRVEADLGYDAVPAGDVNGDYFDDFVVSAYVNGQPRLLVFLGTASGELTGPVRSIPVIAAQYDNFPFGGAQDVNGDGYDDVFSTVASGLQICYGAAASPCQNSSIITGLERGRGLGDINGDGFADIGGVYGSTMAGLYLGGASGISGSANNAMWAAIPNQLGDGNTFVSPAGDLNGDGLADIAVSESRSPKTGFLYFAKPLVLGYPFVMAGQVPLGSVNVGAFSPAGDVNGDGLSDMIAINDTGVALYCGVGRPPLITADVSRTSPVPSGGEAGAVCPAGDVNGDGYDEALVGTPLFSNGQINEGRAALYFGSATGLGTDPGWTFEANQPYALVGSAVCSAGDLNGDGYGDFVVGAYNHSNTVYIEGSIFVFYGGPDGVSSGPEIVSGGQLGAGFGFALSALHDIDGDGFDDLAVGAYAHDGTAANEGAVLIFRGSATGLQPTPSQILQLGIASAGFGYAVSFAGDVNGDGFGDLLVGAPFSSAGATNAGAAYLFLCNGSGLDSTPASSLLGTEVNAHFGQSICGLGDSDGDGMSDVAVAALNAAAGGVDRGRVAIYPGTAFGLANTPSSQIVGAADHAEWGGCIWGPGDINADGLTDLAVLGTGSPCAVAAYLGGVGGVMTTPAWSVAVGAAYPIMASASGPADLNGDSFGDILLPSPGSTDGLTAYFGNASPAISHLSQALGVTGAIVQDGGFTAGPNYLQIRADARSAAGRAPVRLEFEGRSRLQPFNGVGTQFSALRLTGLAGGVNGSAAEFSEVLTGLPFQSQIKWRVRTRSRNPYFPTSPWRERPMTLMVGWTARTPCETCISAVPEPPSRGPLTRAVQVVGNPVAPRGRALTLSVWSAAQGEAVLEILDVAGRLVSTQDVRLQADTWNDAEIQRRALPGASGVYFIRLRAPWGIDSRRVVIE